MSSIFFTIALLAAPIEDIAGPAGTAAPLPEIRPVHAIAADVSQLLQRERQADSDSERASVAYDMVCLYREIKHDPRLVVSQSLKQSKQRLWTRLTRVKKDVLAKIKREGRPDETLSDEEVLALADMELVTQSLSDHLQLAGATLGGPATILEQTGPGRGQAKDQYRKGIEARGGAAAFDYGPALVDLIQQTIVPEFWDVNGGPGTIVYYRPLMCLVVRATSDIHHRLGGTIDALGGVR